MTLQQEADLELATQVQEDFDLNSALTVLNGIFPNADPDFLLEKANEFKGGNQEALNRFIEEGLGSPDKIPNRDEYDRKRKLDQKYNAPMTYEQFCINYNLNDDNYDEHCKQYYDDSKVVSDKYKKLAFQNLKAIFGVDDEKVNRALRNSNQRIVPAFKYLGMGIKDF